MCLAIPGQIVEFCDPERFLARVDVAGVRRVVNVDRSRASLGGLTARVALPTERRLAPGQFA